MKTAYIFPGQGSQFVGMGLDLGAEAKYFDKANSVLGYDLKKICFEGPEETLKQTANAQPAILTMSLAMLKQLKDEDLPSMVAGHSLGEYTALVAAAVLTFEQAVKLVHIRGLLMEKAVPQGEGSMAAIIGLDEETLCKMCQDDKGLVELANLNTHEQIVISGETTAVKRVVEKAETAGAKRAILLQVSGPFHSSLMKVIAEEYEKELNKIEFKNARVPVVSNVLADYVRDSDEIKKLLVRQLFSPVLWRQSVEKMIDDGISKFKEIGPGNVLTGLVRKIVSKVPVSV